MRRRIPAMRASLRSVILVNAQASIRKQATKTMTTNMGTADKKKKQTGEPGASCIKLLTAI